MRRTSGEGGSALSTPGDGGAPSASTSALSFSFLLIYFDLYSCSIFSASTSAVSLSFSFLSFFILFFILFSASTSALSLIVLQEREGGEKGRREREEREEEQEGPKGLFITYYPNILL